MPERIRRRQEGSIIPVSDWRQISTRHGPSIVLWTIREHGPVSFARLFELVFGAGEERASISGVGAMSSSLADALRDLNDGGLVELEGATLDEVRLTTRETKMLGLIQTGSKLQARISARLDVLQQIFNLSLSDYAQGKGDDITVDPIFGPPIQESSDAWPDIFVIMPFRNDLNVVYEKAMYAAARRLGFTCKRGDDFSSSESIMDEVWTAMFHSKLCIADCTGLNANVFYEMGVAHTLGKPCVLVAQSVNDIPFDIRHRRVTIYEPSPQGLKDLHDTLVRAIQNELKLRDKLRQILDKL